MSDKPDCYACVHRRELLGDAHSRCAHPDVPDAVKLGIQGHPHGIRRGWFFWPFNFDPTWLQACNGFTARTR